MPFVASELLLISLPLEAPMAREMAEIPISVISRPIESDTTSRRDGSICRFGASGPSANATKGSLMPSAASESALYSLLSMLFLATQQ